MGGYRMPRPLHSGFTRGALSAALIRVSLTGAGADAWQEYGRYGAYSALLPFPTKLWLL
jgi:hypothetical protein